MQQLIHTGSDAKKLQGSLQYFQQQLLKLQQQAFEKGSPLLDIIHHLRADVNRSCKKIKEQHTYKSAQSVSYMKKVMAAMKIITIKKICIHSTERSRLYVSTPGEAKKRDAYKWLPAKQVTAWFLCDQISHNYQTQKQKENAKKKAA